MISEAIDKLWVQILSFSAKDFIVGHFSRKFTQLNDFQKAELAYPLEAKEKELAKQRQKATQLIGKGLQKQDINDGVHLNTTIEKARDIVARKADLKPTTYHRAKTIIEKAPSK